MTIQRTVAGYAHTHMTRDFYFTPLRSGDKLMPNFHLTALDIELSPRLDSLNDIDDASARSAIEAGESFEQEDWGGLMWTPMAASNPLLLRSPAARYRVVLKKWYKALPDAAESGQSMYRIFHIGHLRLIIKDAGGQPVAGARVVASLETEGASAEGVSDEAGFVYLLDLRPGTYKLIITTGADIETGAISTEAVFEVKSGEINEYSVKLKPVEEGV